MTKNVNETKYSYEQLRGELHTGTTDNIQLIKKHNTHQYKHPKYEDTYPSATTILHSVMNQGNESLMAWQRKLISEAIMNLPAPNQISYDDMITAVNAAQRAKIESADKGTLIHSLIEQILNEDKSIDEMATYIDSLEKADKLNEGIMDQVMFATKWLNERHLRPLAAEYKVISSLMPYYGGTIDLVAADKDMNIHLIDWKTGNHKYDHHKMQIAAYKDALDNSIVNIPYTEYCHIVYTKLHDHTTLDYAAYHKWFNVFENTCEIYDAIRKTSTVFKVRRKGGEVDT